MSEDTVYKSPDEVKEDLLNAQDEEFNEFLEFKKDKLRKAGINVPISHLGDSVRKETVSSYEKLNMNVPDNVRLATLRPNESIRRTMSEAKNKPIPTWKILRHVTRLLDESSGDQYMLHSYALYFFDWQHNIRKSEYSEGIHTEILGSKRYNLDGKKVSSEVEGYKTILNTKWNSKKFAEMLEAHNKAVAELKKIGTPKRENYNLEFSVGYAGRKGIDRNKPVYAIKCAKDLEVGKFDDLYAIGRRGLSVSISESAIPKLRQPVSEDPPNSLEKKARGYINPNQISYNQQSYR